MYSKENAEEFEKSIFNNNTKIEQERIINEKFRKENLSYVVKILNFDNTDKPRTIPVDEYEKIKDILDENYTYVIKQIISRSNYDYIAFNTEISLYVSVYKNNTRCKLFVYKKNRKMYYGIEKFPKKYNDIVNSMLESINPFRI